MSAGPGNGAIDNGSSKFSALPAPPLNQLIQLSPLGLFILITLLLCIGATTRARDFNLLIETKLQESCAVARQVEARTHSGHRVSAALPLSQRSRGGLMGELVAGDAPSVRWKKLSVGTIGGDTQWRHFLGTFTTLD